MNEIPRPAPFITAPPRTRHEVSNHLGASVIAERRAPPRVPSPRHAHAPIRDPARAAPVEERPDDSGSDLGTRALGAVLRPAARALARLIGPAA